MECTPKRRLQNERRSFLRPSAQNDRSKRNRKWSIIKTWSQRTACNWHIATCNKHSLNAIRLATMGIMHGDFVVVVAVHPNEWYFAKLAACPMESVINGIKTSPTISYCRWPAKLLGLILNRLHCMAETVQCGDCFQINPWMSNEHAYEHIQTGQQYKAESSHEPSTIVCQINGIIAEHVLKPLRTAQ